MDICMTLILNYLLNYYLALTETWTTKELACIENHNDKTFEEIRSFEECQNKCEAEPSCNSIEYNKKNLRCQLSCETSLTVPDDYNVPCHADPETFYHADIVPKG